MKKILQACVIVLVILGVMGVVSAGVYVASQNTSVQSLITAGRGAGGPPNGMAMGATGATAGTTQTRPTPPNGMGGDHEQGGINSQNLLSIAKNLGQFAVATLVIVLVERVYSRAFKRKGAKKNSVKRAQPHQKKQDTKWLFCFFLRVSLVKNWQEKCASGQSIFKPSAFNITSVRRKISPSPPFEMGRATGRVALPRFSHLVYAPNPK